MRNLCQTCKTYFDPRETWMTVCPPCYSVHHLQPKVAPVLTTEEKEENRKKLVALYFVHGVPDSWTEHFQTVQNGDPDSFFDDPYDGGYDPTELTLPSECGEFRSVSARPEDIISVPLLMQQELKQEGIQMLQTLKQTLESKYHAA